MQLSGREKATILLSLLGSDVSSRVLRYLPHELAEIIAQGINNLPAPTPEAVKDVVEDFRGFLALPSKRKRGPALTEEIEEAPPPPPPKPETPLERLLKVPAKKMSYLLSFERPQLIAFLLTHFPPLYREEILGNLQDQRQLIEEIIRSYRKTSAEKDLFDRTVNYLLEKLE